MVEPQTWSLSGRTIYNKKVKVVEKMKSLTNSIELIGKVLKINLTEGELTYKSSGKTVKKIEGDITFRVEIEGAIHEPKMEVFCTESSKYFSGYQKVMNEYKTIDDVGEEEADRVKANGKMDKSEYYSSKNSRIAYYNKPMLTSITRKVAEDAEDKSEIIIAGLIRKVAPKKDKEGLPTGEIEIDMINIPWVYGDKTPTLIQPVGLYAQAEYSDFFNSMVLKDTVWKFTAVLERGVEIKEESTGVGFGNYKVVPKKSYSNGIRVIGGEALKDFTATEIEEIVKLRATQRDTIGNHGIQKTNESEKKTGGASFGTNNTPTVDDDMPF